MGVDRYFVGGLSPFVLDAGNLTASTGGEDFVYYKFHKDVLKALRENAEKSFAVQPLIGQPGDGKTWTLSWLLSNFEDKPEFIAKHKTAVIPVIQLETRKPPARALVEAVFKVILSDEKFVSYLADIEPKDDFETSVVSTLKSPRGKWALMGKATARIPIADRDLMPISLTRQEDLLDLLRFAFVRFAEYRKATDVLLLVDETESAFVSAGKRGVIEFLQFLRSAYDSMRREGSQVGVQIWLAGTEVVRPFFKFGEVARQITGAEDIQDAMARRCEDVITVDLPSDDDVVEIAKRRIQRHWKAEHQDSELIPFDQDAILQVWTQLGRNLANFVKALGKVYKFAVEKKAAKITVATVNEYFASREQGAVEREDYRPPA